MAARQSTSRIRQRIGRLIRRREDLEERLISFRHKMLDACLIERHKLAGGRVRRSPAFYLSRKVNSKTKLTYVRKDQLDTVRQQTERWRDYSRTIAEWVKISVEMEQLFRELGRRQVIETKEK